MSRTRRSPLALALVLLPALAVPAAHADRLVVERDETRTFPLEDARTLRLAVPFGEVRVTAGRGDQVETRLVLRCDPDGDRCRSRVARLRIVAERNGEALELALTGRHSRGKLGFVHPDIELHLAVPAALALAVDMGYGEVVVDGLEGGVEVELNAGEARVRVPETAVRSASAKVGIGEASITPHGGESHRRGFLKLGNGVDWRDGGGSSLVSVHVNVGEAAVELLQPQVPGTSPPSTETTEPVTNPAASEASQR